MLDSRLKKLTTPSPILAASRAAYTNRCGRPSCRCRHGGSRRTGQHLTFEENGKTRSVFPPLNDWLDELPDSRDTDAIVSETRFLAWGIVAVTGATG